MADEQNNKIDKLLCEELVKKEQSELNFDYQINGGTEYIAVEIKFRDNIVAMAEIFEKVKHYFAKTDENRFIIEPRWFVLKKKSSKVIKVEVDLGNMDYPENIIKDFMSYLDKNFDNIKKIIVN